MTEDQEREQFEQAAHEHYLAERGKRQIKDDFEAPATRENLMWRQPSGEYGVLIFNAAWWAWKARAALVPPSEYRTSRGRSFSFSGWAPGETPLDHFDRGEWLKCLHGCMFAASRVHIEDDGVLHELVHLALGVDICTHNSLDDLRVEVAAIQALAGETHAAGAPA